MVSAVDASPRLIYLCDATQKNRFFTEWLLYMIQVVNT